MLSALKSVFWNNNGSVVVTTVGIILGIFLVDHFWSEWREDVAQRKVTDAIIKKRDGEKENQEQFEKGVKDGLEKVGTDDIFDIIN